MVHVRWRIIALGLIGFLVGTIQGATNLFLKYGDTFTPSLGLARMAGNGFSFLVIGVIIGVLTRKWN